MQIEYRQAETKQWSGQDDRYLQMDASMQKLGMPCYGSLLNSDAIQHDRQGSDTQVRTQKTQWVFWVHPPKKPTPKKPTLLL